MNRPDQGRAERDHEPLAGVESKTGEKFFGKEAERDRGHRVPDDAHRVIKRRLKADQSVIKRVGQTLHRPVKIRRRRADKKKVIEPFGNEPPTSNEWIAQNQRRVVPDKTVQQDRKSTRLNSSHTDISRMPSSA